MKLLNIIVALALTAPAALAQQPGTPGTPGTLTLRGVVVTANDTPLPRVRVAPPVATADGSFPFANVGPGVYAVQATGDADSKGLDARTSAGQFAASSVIVTANDPPRLELRLAQGARLEGRLRYEGVPAEPPPLFNLAPLPINRDLAPPLGDGWNSVSLQPGDTFEFQGVFGPTLLRELFHQTDWYLKSVVIRGQEQVDSPFDFGTSGTFCGRKLHCQGSAAGRLLGRGNRTPGQRVRTDRSRRARVALVACGSDHARRRAIAGSDASTDSPVKT